MVLAATAAIFVAALMSLSWKQCRAWHDSISLWSYAWSHGGDRSGVGVLWAWAVALQEAGSIDEAVKWYRESLRLAPFLPDTHGNLGLIFTSQGKVSDALAQFREAVRLKPHSIPLQTNLASCLASLGDLSEAAVHYAEVTRLAPISSKVGTTGDSSSRHKAAWLTRRLDSPRRRNGDPTRLKCERTSAWSCASGPLPPGRVAFRPGGPPSADLGRGS